MLAVVYAEYRVILLLCGVVKVSVVGPSVAAPVPLVFVFNKCQC
jgi:hypothetical protein